MSIRHPARAKTAHGAEGMLTLVLRQTAYLLSHLQEMRHCVAWDWLLLPLQGLRLRRRLFQGLPEPHPVVEYLLQLAAHGLQLLLQQ